jgi:hypothetical protein
VANLLHRREEILEHASRAEVDLGVDLHAKGRGTAVYSDSQGKRYTRSSALGNAVPSTKANFDTYAHIQRSGSSALAAFGACPCGCGS